MIVGSGLAGYQLAREWRKLDSQTPLLIISQDDARAYAKPMLSTGLAKDKSAEQLVQAEAGAMAEQLKAQIRSRSVRRRGSAPAACRAGPGESVRNPAGR